MILRQSTQIKVRVGPFVDATDGVTPETTVSLSTADQAELLKANGAATVDISAAAWAAVTGADGWYDLTLTTSHTDTVGTLDVVVQDQSLCLPVFARFQVVEEAVYDALYAASATGYLAPTVGGRTLDVTATGAAGIDWGNVENASTSVDLSATAINLCDTVTTNTDMRGTDNAFLAASAPTNFGDLAITATTGKVTVGTNDDKTGYSISGTKTTLDALNDITAAAAADAVWDESTVGHTTAGTFGEQLKTDVDAILADTNELQTDDVPGLIAALNDPTAAAIADAVWDEALAGHVTAGSAGKAVADIETDATAILGDTNELQTDLTNGGRLDLLIDAILTDTGTTIPGLIAALNDISVADVLTTQMTESYATDGTAPTLTQALMLIQQALTEFAISGTTTTIKKLDGTTTAATLTHDDAANATSATRST